MTAFRGPPVPAQRGSVSPLARFREDTRVLREQAIRVAADLIVRDFDADYIEVLEDTQGEDYDAPQTYLKIECKDEIRALSKTIADRLAAEGRELKQGAGPPKG